MPKGETYKLVLKMIEYPLRALVLVAQVHAQMWKRNGYAILHQVTNYQEIRFVSEMFDRDILMLQVDCWKLWFCVKYFENIYMETKFHCQVILSNLHSLIFFFFFQFFFKKISLMKSTSRKWKTNYVSGNKEFQGNIPWKPKMKIVFYRKWITR